MNWRNTHRWTTKGDQYEVTMCVKRAKKAYSSKKAVFTKNGWRFYKFTLSGAVLNTNRTDSEVYPVRGRNFTFFVDPAMPLGAPDIFVWLRQGLVHDDFGNLNNFSGNTTLLFGVCTPLRAFARAQPPQWACWCVACALWLCRLPGVHR